MIIHIKNKIETILKENGKDRYPFLEILLLVLSYGYGSVLKIRKTFYRTGLFKAQKLPCVVISIGNLTVGGTGKTPMTIKVAKKVTDLGYKAAVISRGYKGTASKTGGIVSDGKDLFMGYDRAGDEPYMMATHLNNIPVAVGQNRFKAGLLVNKSFNPDVIILDDAFQHLKLKRDIDIVLIDYHRPFGNNHLLPRGILRESVSALSRADVFILTRSDSDCKSPLDKPTAFDFNKPVFKTFHRPFIQKHAKASSSLDVENPKLTISQDFSFLKSRRVCAFSGIAKNEAFRKTIEGFGCNVVAFIEYSDHHRYSDEDRIQIIRQAEKAQADLIITTEKDSVRFARTFSFPYDFVVIGIEIGFADGGDAFDTFLSNRLAGLIKKGFQNRPKISRKDV